MAFKLFSKKPQTPQGSEKPTVLLILDGWGLAPASKANAISLAKTPNMDGLPKLYPNTALFASGESVGLPAGEVGNTEVGHLTMGAGRTILQELKRITKSIEDGSFFQTEAFLNAAAHAKGKGTRLHIMGLVGDGQVHSSIDHFYALLDFVKRSDLKGVYLHLFTDGRDSNPTRGAEIVEKIESYLVDNPIARISTVMGRYYAMDRDRKWDRTKMALTLPDFEKLKEFEFDYDPGQGVMKKEKKSGKTFKREAVPKDLFFVTMTQYQKNLPVHVAFSLNQATQPLTQVVSMAGKKALKISESEKERFVKYHFNGFIEEPFQGEDVKIVPSPSVPTYDKKPEMSAPGIVKEVKSAIQKGIYSLIVINLANPDMVAHTGKLDATIKACEAADKAVGEIVKAAVEAGGTALITADHGNAEELLNFPTKSYFYSSAKGSVNTDHSANPVPLIIASQALQNNPKKLSQGTLADIAPTILAIMGIQKPEVMTGKNLLTTNSS